MPSDVIEIDEHCLSGKGYPPHAFRLTQKFREYALFMQKCLIPYDKECIMSDDDEMSTAMALVVASGRMCPKGELEIRSEAAKGSPEDILELGIRQGGPPQNPRVGLEQWLYLIDVERGGRLATPPNRRILSQAHSCIAWYYIEKVHRNSRKPKMGDLTRAAEAANAAAHLGYFTPAVIATAEYIDEAVEKESGKQYWEVSPFDTMKDLRCVYERQQRELEAGEEPNVQRCAWPECWLEGTKDAPLMKCNGKCTEPYKPRYCSRECQKQDWKRHKPKCKPGPPTPSASEDGSEEEEEEQAAGPSSRALTKPIISGLPVHTSSTTMSP
ncbi:hypothetical protein EVJ58_g558 [Rhodofomes roseus]|uniref:MYND-type domain-containing protein n=1 Tax=Rhodofomes roseus TaxID=34475 RepID=A0A4Y9Z5P1_9APHY|nr:hypothetical protein EVJ58_g558 [Rhodofomes roseus]